MKAYKATNSDMKCLDFQYELGKEFIHNGELGFCLSGFHFCKHLIDVFRYYDFAPFNKFWEVEIPDDAIVIDGDDKSVTNKIKFIRELSNEEIKDLTNEKVFIQDDGAYNKNGNQYYYRNGKLHREDGPAVIRADGSQEYYRNGKYHREDGPAVIGVDGTQYYFRNGMYHRVDGPAVLYPDGTRHYYLNGKELSKEQFETRNTD